MNCRSRGGGAWLSCDSNPQSPCPELMFLVLKLWQVTWVRIQSPRSRPAWAGLGLCVLYQLSGNSATRAWEALAVLFCLGLEYASYSAALPERAARSAGECFLACAQQRKSCSEPARGPLGLSHSRLGPGNPPALVPGRMGHDLNSLRSCLWRLLSSHYLRLT